jgi:Zn-dependent protease
MNVISLVISLFVLLFAITIHEAAHGWAASKLGDDTARSMGRVTLNPIAHIDPFGTVLLPLLLAIAKFPVFGWAKPVQVNPFNLKNPRRDNLWISAAGPLSNIMAAALFLLGIVLVKSVPLSRGSLFHTFFQGFFLVLYQGAFINAYLAIFNLIPVPPLDGGGVLMGLLSEEGAQKYERIRPYGFIIIIGLIYLGILGFIANPILQIIDKIARS